MPMIPMSLPNILNTKNDPLKLIRPIMRNKGKKMEFDDYLHEIILDSARRSFASQRPMPMMPGMNICPHHMHENAEENDTDDADVYENMMDSLSETEVNNIVDMFEQKDVQWLASGFYANDTLEVIHHDEASDDDPENLHPQSNETKQAPQTTNPFDPDAFIKNLSDNLSGMSFEAIAKNFHKQLLGDIDAEETEILTTEEIKASTTNESPSPDPFDIDAIDFENLEQYTTEQKKQIFNMLDKKVKELIKRKFGTL